MTKNVCFVEMKREKEKEKDRITRRAVEREELNRAVVGIDDVALAVHPRYCIRNCNLITLNKNK